MNREAIRAALRRAYDAGRRDEGRAAPDYDVTDELIDDMTADVLGEVDPS